MNRRKNQRRLNVKDIRDALARPAPYTPEHEARAIDALARDVDRAEPPVRGGQGRTPRDVTRDGQVAGVCLTLLGTVIMAGLVVWAVLAVIGGGK